MPHKRVPLEGILAAVTTPFTSDGAAVDHDRIRTQVDRLLAAGIAGIVPCGTTGEFTSLSPQEHRDVITTYVQAVGGRVPVIAGTASLTTAGAIELAQFAEQAGADAVMVMPPFYDPLDFDALKLFYAAVAEAITVPIMFYNAPGVSGVHLSPAEIAELGSIDGVDYLKDSSGDAVGLTDLIVNRANDIEAFNGSDVLTFCGLALGAKASVWGVAGILPEQAVQLFETVAVKGDLEAGREQWRGLWAVSDVLESVNYVAGVKAALELTGNSAGPARFPVQPISADKRAELGAALRAAGATVVGS